MIYSGPELCFFLTCRRILILIVMQGKEKNVATLIFDAGK